MGLRELRSELESMEPFMLIHHITELYKKYPEVKSYFDFYLEPDLDALLDQYKLRVYEGFYPPKGKKSKLHRARKAINEFKKLSSSEEAVAALLLYFTQISLQHTLTQKSISESNCNRIASSLRTTLEFLAKHGLLESYESEVNEVVARCENAPFELHQQVALICTHFYD